MTQGEVEERAVGSRFVATEEEGEIHWDVEPDDIRVNIRVNPKPLSVSISNGRGASVSP